MYCKNCNGNVPADFWDEFSDFCDDECKAKYAKDRGDRLVGNVMTWIIVALLVGTIIFMAIPAKATHYGDVEILRGKFPISTCSLEKDGVAILCEIYADHDARVSYLAVWNAEGTLIMRVIVIGLDSNDIKVVYKRPVGEPI